MILYNHDGMQYDSKIRSRPWYPHLVMILVGTNFLLVSFYRLIP